ncbi:MAG: GvpL/GvpF family gas vesicle protein, partial [Acidobacteria bacterium]|nr:GvpL/GvpF family gas vesicle protein [Acidobacteriota bacterium]
VRILKVGAVHAAVEMMQRPPRLTARTLRVQHGIVEAIADRTRAVLPARFGAFLAGRQELTALVQDRQDALVKALRLVMGREQMTLRIFGPRAVPGPGASRARPLAPSGAGYLASRAGALRAARAVPEVAPLRAALEPLVEAERAERHDRGELLASVYHLIRRGDSAVYFRAVERGRAHAPGLRIFASGPWPPYAFAPELGE